MSCKDNNPKIMIEPEIMIAETSDGGYIVARRTYGEEENFDPYGITVYGNDNESDSEGIDTTIRMLYDLLEMLGIFYSKHNQYNIKIMKVFGSNYDPADDELVELLEEMYWELPTDDIVFRCKYHPEYKGEVEPANTCRHCKVIYNFVKRTNVFSK